MGDDMDGANAEITPAQVMADVSAMPTFEEQIGTLRALLAKPTQLTHALLNSDEFTAWLYTNMEAILASVGPRLDDG